jgi:hypothetical protein
MISKPATVIKFNLLFNGPESGANLTTFEFTATTPAL